MPFHNGNRDSIAFCEDYCRVRCDATQGYCAMNMRAACPSEMSVKFCAFKCRHIPDFGNVHGYRCANLKLDRYFGD
jgi:hypothetical protein